MSDDTPTQAWKRANGKLNITELPDMEALAAEAYYTDAAGKEPYGDVEYADPGYQKDGKKRYPLDTPAHVRSAHSYFSKPSNYQRYTPAQRAKIKAKIDAAWRKKIHKDGPPSDSKKD